MNRLLVLVFACALLSSGQTDQASIIGSYEAIWTTLRDHYWDASMAGLPWQDLHDRYLTQVKASRNLTEARKPMNDLIHQLPSSHLALIPAETYSPAVRSASAAASGTPHHNFGGQGTTGLTLIEINQQMVVFSSDHPQVHAGWIVRSIEGDELSALTQSTSVTDPTLAVRIATAWLSGPVGSSVHVVFTNGAGMEVTLNLSRALPAGKLVQFANLPPLRVLAEHRLLTESVGYLRLNIFLDPVSVMPELQQAISDFHATRGIILDLRGNPGGLGVMAAGIAGWFVSEPDQMLGTTVARQSRTKLVVNPRANGYQGKLAILIDQGSASTSEILAQGLKDLGRARLFGNRSAGAALPSQIVELPDGDRFQYPEANYTSFKGRVLEGNGVEPDVQAPATVEALLAGRDLALEAASQWIGTP